MLLETLRTMKNGEKPIANPYVLLREEFDDWAILFNPDTGHGFGLNPTGVYVWKLLDGEHTLAALLEELRDHADNVPEDASDHIKAFVDALVANGLAGFGSNGSGFLDHADMAKLHLEKCSYAPPEAMDEVKPFTYGPPKLVDLSGREAPAHGDACDPSGSNASNNCWTGASAGQQCHTNGSSAGNACNCTGASPSGSNNCQVGNCPNYLSDSCLPGGTLCFAGPNALKCSTCSSGGYPSL